MNEDPVFALEEALFISFLAGIVYFLAMPGISAFLLEDDYSVIGETRRRSLKIPTFVRSFLSFLGSMAVFISSFLLIELQIGQYVAVAMACSFGLGIVVLSTYCMGLSSVFYDANFAGKDFISSQH